MPDFGTLKMVELRNLWQHEASNFTHWLADNIGALGEALWIDLGLIETEADVGDFSLDLHAKDLGTGHKVIIPNGEKPAGSRLSWQEAQRRSVRAAQPQAPPA